MWGLDRISNYSTPSGTPPPRHDSYSPAPRRGYPPAGPGPLPIRPGLNPRSSSLSLSLVSPGASTTSLPSTARLPNGGPRRRPTGGVPPNLGDPVQVLESIMGGPPRRYVATERHAADQQEKPEEVDADIDFGPLSLQAFAEEPVQQRQAPSVDTYSAQSVEECTCFDTVSTLVTHRDCR